MKCKRFTAEQVRLAAANLLIWSKHRIPLENFRQGIDVEREHGDVTGCDPIETGKIAIAHLLEDKDYYRKLARMERGACGR